MNMYGPDFTFLGVPRVGLSDVGGADVAILGAPYDGGTSFRAGCRFGPSAIRGVDCQPYNGSRPHLALRVDPLQDLRVVDVGDIEMPAGEIALSLERLEEAVAILVGQGALPVVLGGDHSITYADVSGLHRHFERVGLLHFDAHADTGETHFGRLYGHGTPMRRLIEEGACRADRFYQIGLRGYWPDPATLSWMAEQGMRCYEMTEVRARGLDLVVDEVCDQLGDCDAVFLSVDIDVVEPGQAPGTGTPEPGGLAAWELLDAVRRVCLRIDVHGMDIVEVAPGYDNADVTALLANRTVLEALSAVCRRRLERAGGPVWQPDRPLLDER